MEIRIDTEKDSHEHIRKAISFLQTIIGEEAEITNSPKIDENKDLFGMFNDSNSSSEKPSSEGDSMFSIFNDENDTEKPKNFSLNDELTKEDINIESEDNDDNISIIPY